MSDPEPEPPAPAVGKSIPELLAEIRDLLEHIATTLARQR